MTEFEQRVAEVLLRLAPGDVMTYGEVAAEAGHPGAARAVGRILATSPVDYPWWRVVAAGGRLHRGGAKEQAKRLRAEGVRIERGHVMVGS
jgi:methylated-DNA-protein-cysteine methyltransferase-like protein